jgi:Ca2+-binding RTX toxin-like protein
LVRVRGNYADLYLINARSDRDRLNGGVGDDFIVGGYDIDILVGGQGNDELIGSSRFGGQHQWDGIDVLWGDEENGDGSSDADIFVVGEDGERYYDDNVVSDISSISQGRGHYALIKDFNASAGDRIQLAALSSGEYQTKLTTPARERLNGADNPNAVGPQFITTTALGHLRANYSLL